MPKNKEIKEEIYENRHKPKYALPDFKIQQSGSTVKKVVETPSVIARLFESGKGYVKKIGAYFEEAKQIRKLKILKEKEARGEHREDISQFIEQNEEKVDLSAYRDVLEATSEAVDFDVSAFEERSENGLANLEEKVEEVEAGEDVAKEAARTLELFDREAEEAKSEFEEEVMSDEEYEARAKEAERVLGDLYKVPTPKELEQKIARQKQEKFAKLGYKVLSPEELKKKQEEKEVKMESLPAEVQLRIIKDQLENLKEEHRKFKKRAEESRQITRKYRPETYKKNQELIKEIMKLEKEEKKIEKELKEFEEEFGKAFKKESKSEARAGEAEEIFEEDKKEREDVAPFGKKVIDESYEKYLEIKKYEEEHGVAPKGESADMYLSFSFKDYQNALDKNPKKASKMEEEMYEKLAMGGIKPKGQSRRETSRGKIRTSIRGENL